MRSQVFRNLDQPFEIFGFSAVQMTLLCCSLVVGGELVELIGVHRIWSILMTALFAVATYWIRRSFDPRFGRRLIRFARLPMQTREKVVNPGRLT